MAEHGALPRRALVGAPSDRPFSAALVAGDLVFVSGQVGTDPRTGTVAGQDVAAQTAQILDNLAALLGGAESTLDDVVKTTVFLTDIRDLPAMNDVYQARFAQPRPTRSTVAVAALARPELKVEIEAIALRREEHA